MMAKIVLETEHQMVMEPQPERKKPRKQRLSVAETICECMAHSAEDLDLAAIAIFTESGLTARLLSKYRPEPPIYALSSDAQVIQRMTLLWGTFPIQCARYRDTDKLVQMAEDILEQGGLVREREIVGIVAGTQTRSGATNFMRLHMVGDRDANDGERRASSGEHLAVR